MTDLPPYSGDTDGVDCAKCGFDEAETEYLGVREDQAERASITGAPWVGEFHKRVCARCGYQWAEACLPQDGPTPEQTPCRCSHPRSSHHWHAAQGEACIGNRNLCTCRMFQVETTGPGVTP